MWWVSEIHFVV